MNKEVTKELLMGGAGLAVPTLVTETEVTEETTEEVVEEVTEESVEEEVHAEEVDEGEMVADEASASSEIKEFMEAHCTVEELDQMYEYLQEMMKRVAETAKEDGKRYAKLAKKMARK